MKQQVYYRQQSFDEMIDDEHLIEFENLLFNELLYNIKKVPFADIINKHLVYNTNFYGYIYSYSLHWLYTADRMDNNSGRIYSFRFPNPCNPDYYKSFITKYHPFFASIDQTRHRVKGWYKYTGKELPKMIGKYLNIVKITNKQNSHKTKILINNEYERLDIEFYFRSDSPERITITFEPGYPAVV